jgi:CubicO group peptidase (beta-lactamase class C family)
VSVFGFLVLVLFVSFGLGAASAQTNLPDALKNRPPVAAPTMQIDVAPIQVVRSMSEIFSDFGGGLIEGLLSSHNLKSAVLVAVQDGRIIVNKSFGNLVDAEFRDGLYSDVFASVAVMQQIERRRLGLQDRVPGAGDVTVEQVLTHRADPALLRQIVETASGQDFRGYVDQNILEPVAAGQTISFSETTGRFLVALTGNGAIDGRMVLGPAAVDLMGQTHVSIHPALPGWTYGFAELRRNGWRGLQWDGVWQTTPAAQARLVAVPEARLGYLIIVEGQASASFWRMLDDTLFDRVLPSRNSTNAQVPSSPAPDAVQARAVAGRYEISDEASAAPLKSAGMRLVVTAAEDGSLHLTGGEDAVLTPQPGGYWAADDGNLNAVASDGRLILSRGIYLPLRWWKRPALYASLALVSAVGAAGAFASERRARGTTAFPRKLAVALSGAVAAFLALTLFVWHLSPAL